MNVFAISDLHLSGACDKPMDIFGGAWENYWQQITEDWCQRVQADDLVLIAGDISWAMRLAEAKVDLDAIGALPGKKVILRGNHDYWWSSYQKVKQILPPDMLAIQNNAFKMGEYVIAGTRGWTQAGPNSDPQDKAIFEREVIRLRLSLEEAAKIRGEERLIVMMHYPPFDANFVDSAFTCLMEEFSANAVVYGHLHGKECRSKLCVIKRDIPYYLTSCDQVKNRLVQLF